MNKNFNKPELFNKRFWYKVPKSIFCVRDTIVWVSQCLRLFWTICINNSTSSLAFVVSKGEHLQYQNCT